MRDAIRATGRDYEKLKTQFDHSKRNAIRNEIAGSVAGPVPLHMSTPRSSHAVTSIPQPFFAAVGTSLAGARTVQVSTTYSNLLLGYGYTAFLPLPASIRLGKARQ